MVLDERVLKELKDIHSKLRDEGKLPSVSKLSEYLARFRAKFGPDVLRNLDGEALLNTIHNHANRDSLVYWLEFKNDEEFPAIFGGIGGGSALKFGIYLRKETGAWMAGSPTQQKELTIEEAIAYARKHREQLVKGAELLEGLDPAGGDAAYRRIQSELDKAAPDISNSAWGHKYFSLLFPGKIEELHAVRFQKFHLIKLLQVPPEGAGRYLAGGLYFEIARKLEVPMTHLSFILGRRHGKRHAYWRVGTSDRAERRNRWNRMRDGLQVAIGWDKLGDLSDLKPEQESKEKIRQLLQAHYPGRPQGIGRAANQVLRFCVGAEEGDLVIAMDGGTVLGIGRIAGPYEFDAASDFPHHRPVEWLSLDEWQLPHPEGLRTTFVPLKNDRNLIEIEKHVLHDLDRPPKPTSRIVLDGMLGRIQSILERKAQVILYGPPGTGKTYWATTAARRLSSVYNSNDKDKRFVRMCCFHPAYGYEDFIEGYRPKTVDGKMVFDLQVGVFKKLCEDAGADPERRYYLVIDEINRGDIPRIFGELLSVLEKDKRGAPILLPLTGKPFAVPLNVFVIGTMNTADRSIALLDTALRRRFGFIELMPDSAVLGDAAPGGIPLGPWLEALNDRIRIHVGRDARNLQVGHSYLLENEKPITEFGRFAKVFREDILPLVQEYCYEDYSTLERILGTTIVDSAKDRIREELFDPSKQDDLVSALLAPCPEISATAQAVASAAEDTEQDSEDDDSSEEDQEA